MCGRTATILVLLCVAHSCRAEILPLRTFTTIEGLAHDHVSRIFVDSQHFLWVCTDDGLSRFDGVSFVNYTRANGLPHMHVNDIVESARGEYWVATDDGAVLLRPTAFTPVVAVYRPAGNPESLFINAVAVDQDGSILIGTSAGLFRICGPEDHRRIEPVSIPAAGPDVAVHTLLIDVRGNLWAGTSTGLLLRDRAGAWTRFTTRHGLPHDYVGHLVGDPDGHVWACTRLGLVRLADHRREGQGIADLMLTERDGLPHPDVRDILFEPGGRRWLATLGGLVEWREAAPRQSRFRAFVEANGLTDREVYTLVHDPARNLWLGTRRGGVMRLSRSGFESYGKVDGLSFSGTDSLVRSVSGQVCVAAITDPARTVRCPDGRGFRQIELPLPPQVRRSMPGTEQSTIQDHLGAWWLTSARGAVRLSKGSAPLALLSDRETRRVFEDNAGDVWLTAQRMGRYGLFRWRRRSGNLEDLSELLPPAARERNINALTETAPGTIWIGLTRPGGLFRLRAGHFEEIGGMPSGRISSLFRDDSGKLWISTLENGVGVIDAPEEPRVRVRFYTTSEGLSSNEVWSVAADTHGAVYAGTARGVDRIDPQYGGIRRYSVGDGLPRGDIRAVARDSDGYLWFLSNRGLARLRPALQEPAKNVVTRITALRLSGAPQRISDLGETALGPFRWPFNRNAVEIHYSAIDYSSLEAVRYQYRLEGSNPGWSEPSTNAVVNFPELSPGKYRFEVRAVQSSAPAAITFVIAPPLWRQTWFEALAFGAALAVFYVWHRLRLAHELEVERVRSRIAADLHDDIAAGLSRTAMLSEALKLHLGASESDSARMLADIADNSRSLIESMSDIVWSIDPRRDRLQDLAARLRAFGSDILEPVGIRWTFTASDEALDERLSADQRRQMFLMGKEAIHNIARHAHATEAAMRVAVADQWLVAEIDDNGRGNNGTAGLGIHSMRSRAALLGGTFEIENKPCGGTRATVRFPLARHKRMNMRLRSMRQHG